MQAVQMSNFQDDVNFLLVPLKYFKEIPEGLRDYAISKIVEDDEKWIIIAGGVLNGNEISNKVYKIQYNEVNSVYKSVELSPMVKKRYSFELVEYEDKLYAIGGCSKKSSIEVYEPELNMWTLLDGRMNISRYNFGCVLYKDKIFVSGGNTSYEQILNKQTLLGELDDNEYCGNFFKEIAGVKMTYYYTIDDFKNQPKKIKVRGTNYTDTVEVFDIKTGIWSLHSTMNESRSYHKMIVFSENATPYLYVIGGKILETDFERTSEEYKGYVTTTNIVEQMVLENCDFNWDYTIPLQNRRTGFEVIVRNNDFLIFGGEIFGNGYGKTGLIEMYIPSKYSRNLNNNFMYSRNSKCIQIDKNYVLVE
jgi:hypothetical protein